MDESKWGQDIAPFEGEISRCSRYLDAAVGLLADKAILEVELLATVQYAWCALVASGEEGSESEVTEFIRAWSQEKEEKFPPERVRFALNLLQESGWLGPGRPDRPSPLADPSPVPGEVLLA
jgi:hypothetical protein